MSTLTPDAIAAVLDRYVHPLIGRSLLAAGAVRRIEAGRKPVIDLEIGFPAAGLRESMAAAVRAEVKQALGVEPEVRIEWKILSQAVQKNLQPMAGVRNIIAVASGKGGVGKSTVAVNLALALQAEGARVGILDADIYGPSQPMMLGSRDRPQSPDGKNMHPIVAHGLQAMSIGFLIQQDDQPMIWRGPVVIQALTQLLNETRWDDLDYLVVDLPPGTGDIQLSLSQRVPVSGAVIVTTPQDIALLDAKKGLQMFRKVGIPVLGVVENMSVFCCPNCGHNTPVFGEGGGARMAQDYGVEMLGRLPLDIRIREQADSGKPTVAADPESDLSQLYRDIARRTAAGLAYGTADDAFPTIEVTDD